MPSMLRKGDLTVGHQGFPPKPITSGASSVLIEGKPAARQGDTTAIHCKGPSCHTGAITGGSSSVFIEGKPAALQGHADCCGDTLSKGSSSVSCS